MDAAPEYRAELDRQIGATGAARVIATLATLLILGVASGELKDSPRESDC